MTWLGRVFITFIMALIFGAIGYGIGSIKPIAPEFIPIGLHSAYLDDVGDVMCFDEVGWGNLRSFMITLGEQYK